VTSIRLDSFADRRLDAVLGQIRSLDVDATGRVGVYDPLTAFGDAIREFGPNHILIGLRATDHAGWQERGFGRRRCRGLSSVDDRLRDRVDRATV
jgi:hypothetical protein